MIKKIKHKTKMRRRIMNHSTYSNSQRWEWFDTSYGYKVQFMSKSQGACKGRRIGNTNTNL